MPSYSITVCRGSIDDERKAALAKAITLAHGEVTGTPFYMAQVIVNEIEPDCYYLGGRPLECDQIFVHGSTREGRTRETKDVLIARLTADVANAIGYDPGCVWVYISEMPACQMVEFGRILPEPGQEIAWNEAWSLVDKAHFARIGIGTNRV